MKLPQHRLRVSLKVPTDMGIFMKYSYMVLQEIQMEALKTLMTHLGRYRHLAMGLCLERMLRIHVLAKSSSS